MPRAFDPGRAERTFESLGDAIDASPDSMRALLASAFGNSPYLCRLALRERETLRKFWEQGANCVLEDAIRAARKVHEADGTAAAMAALRAAKRRAALAIALADIAGDWDILVVTEALTRFADASVGGALRFLLGEAARKSGLHETDPEAVELKSGLVVLAMGKAGGFELNYSSDIDLVTFYEAERFPFRKKGEARGAAIDLVKNLVKLLGETTADGYVFRVDLRLRPDAGATQIAISTEAAERYYEEMGQNWERAAYIKARACAGDLNAGEAFLKRLEPFVWRRNLDFAAIDDIHSIKRQIHAHAGHGAIATAGHNIKLGRGGIREIEFFAQTQQLILGGRDPSLRQRRTLDAIEALRARGLVSDIAAGELAHAYRYLRHLEHRLQTVDDEQTHTVPPDETGFAHIACFSGYSDAQSFEGELASRLRSVQEHYDRLFERAPSLGAGGRSLSFTGVEDDPETLDTLTGIGFRDPAHVAGAIRAWHHGRIRATRSARSRELLTKLVPSLLDVLAKTADPDSAFVQFDRFVSRLPAGVQFFSLLLANPEMLDLLASIAGSAPRLADDLARTPAMLDAVLDRGFLSGLPPRASLDRLLTAQLETCANYETVLDAARRFAKEQMFRVIAQLIAGKTTPPGAAECFSNIAEVLIAALLAHVERGLAQTSGAMPQGSFCVVALGRLGGREMTANSDLDLLFVYDAPDAVEQSDGARPLPPMVYYGRLAQRLIAALTTQTAEGGLYEVDMRLRPTGNKGPVAVSLKAFARYHAQDAWTWERLALTRARLVAGPEQLRAKVAAIIRDALTGASDIQNLARDSREMREKITTQFPGSSRWDLKFAVGGLVDIEFLAQYLQLRHAAANSAVLATNTVEALTRLAAAGFLGGPDSTRLIAAVQLQFSLLQILRISVRERFEPEIATRGMKALLVRASDEKHFADLEMRLSAAQSQARAIFDRLLPAVSA